MDNKMIFASNTKDQIAIHLARDYNVEYWDSFEETDVKPTAFLIDFSYYNNFETIYDEMIDYAIIMRIPIIFLNITNSDHLSKKFGLGFKSKAIVVRPYADFDVFDTIDLQYETKVNPTIIYLKHKNPVCVKPSDNLSCFSCHNTPGVKARKIDNIINSKFLVPIGSLEKSELPESQYKKIYLNIIRNEQISSDSNQKCYNETIIEINLFASFNPKTKYLQVRTLGNGINPGVLTSNYYMERGWFQGDFNITMNLLSNQLSMISNQPRDAAYKDNYTAGANFVVGIDVNENPTFNSNFEVRSSDISELKGFKLDNKTNKNLANWYWVIDILNKDLFDISYGGEKHLKELPSLAVSNLKPLTDTLWSVENTFEEVISMDIKLEETLLYASTRVHNDIDHLCLGQIKVIKQIYGHYNQQALNIDFSVIQV